MNDIFLTPPPFVRCNCPNEARDSDGNCVLCEDSPLPGYLPQYYTPEQYRDWIRRENDMPDYELPDDIPVWAYSAGTAYFSKGYMQMTLKRALYNKSQFDWFVIATIAGKPPEDCRPENKGGVV